MGKRGPKPKPRTEPQPEPRDDTEVLTDDSTLPNKSLFRIDEVARYFNVSERTIRLWIDHKHLECEKIVGSIRIPRESILKCRFKTA